MARSAGQTRLALEVKWAREEAAHWELPRRLLPLVEEAPRGVVSYLGGASHRRGIDHIGITELADYLLAHLS